MVIYLIMSVNLNLLLRYISFVISLIIKNKKIIKNIINRGYAECSGIKGAQYK